MVLLYGLFTGLSYYLIGFGNISLTLGVGLSLSFVIDTSSHIFATTLLSISVSVLLWSYYYINSEAVYRQFFGLVLLFLGSMFCLVFAGDLLCLFVAWDLLGFSSFFLVIFYRSRASIAGGLLTGLSNRLGDVFFLAFFGLLSFGERSGMSWVLYLLLLVSFTKSAQVPFSAWLPAAMLAPTPVSALVHSSTLVTAGVYLLYRYSVSGFGSLLFVGVLTTLVAGMAALLEVDVKKIVAYSTIRQLGVMVRSLGLGERAACFAHLNTHASFKALTFLVVGTLFHCAYGSQESRASGLLHSVSPLLILVLSGALASMCGLVFLSGWVRKEAILELRISSSFRVVFLLLFYAGLGLTTLYSLRLFSKLYSPLGFVSSSLCSTSLPRQVAAPLLFLFVVSIGQGSVLFAGTVARPAVVSETDKLVV